jgi:predicted DNA-binding protein
MAKNNSADRHSPDSVQLKAWVPAALRTRFNACCKAQGTPAASALRSLVEAYCAQVESFGQSEPEGVDGAR